MRRCVEFDSGLESTANGGRLFVGADSHGAGSHRHGCSDHSIHSKTVERIIPITRFRRRACAWHDLYDAEGSLLCTSESVLRIVGSHAALFFRRARLGDADAGKEISAIYSRHPHFELGDEQFRRLLDCSFGDAASLCCKSFGYAGPDRPRRRRSA